MLALKDIVEKLRQRAWYVDCFEMKLGQPSVDGPAQYQGPGYLRQEPDGTIVYKGLISNSRRLSIRGRYSHLLVSPAESLAMNSSTS